MRPEIHATMAAQHGLITRSQALEHGLTARQVDRLVTTGTWTPQRRGVYAATVQVEAAASTRERRLLRDRAAALRIGPDHVASHDFAAYEMDLQVLHARRPFTHVTRPGVVGAHLRHGVKHHLAPFDESQVIVINDRQVLAPPRTAVDIAREHGRLAGMVAMDSALRIGVTKDELRAAAARMRSWPQVTVVRECIGLADPDTDSLVETLGRDLVGELGFGRPQTQFGLTDGHRTAWADLRLGRHFVECDGLAKYRRVEDGGWATGSPEDALDAEKSRQDWLCGFKMGMSRLTFADHFGPRRQVALARVRREFLDTCERFGTDISDLEPYLAPGPRPRPVERWWPMTGRSRA